VTFMPTTRMRVEVSTSTEDGYGDPVDSWATLHTDVRAAITERRKRVWNPTDSRVATVVWYEALLPGALEVPDGARLSDLYTGARYHVTHVRPLASIAFPGATQLVELVFLQLPPSIALYGDGTMLYGDGPALYGTLVRS